MINYTSQFKKFITSQQIYAGMRMALAIVIPSLVLHYFGLLREYFLFPLGTVFIGFTDSAGAFIRRRNALILSVACFFLATLVASYIREYPPLIFLGMVIFGIFFTMLGIYGQRMAAVGGFTLVAFSIFIDGQLSQDGGIRSVLIFTAGSLWFLIVFLISFRLQPYKLVGQMIGENYLQLASYFKIKAKYYAKNPNYENINKLIISKQVEIKNLQENTRESVFKTRIIVNEATTHSRLLMLMFLNSIDLFDKLMTSIHYKRIQQRFGDNHQILNKISEYIILLSEELSKIGIALQSGDKKVAQSDIDTRLDALYQEYFELRSREMSPDSLEDFMSLRFALSRITEVTEAIKTIYKIYNQDLKSVKSLSTGLDFKKFLPQEEKLNVKVFFNNFSLKSTHFRHSIRIAIALLLGYGVSQIEALAIGHSYWILITILAIMRSAYSITKYRNTRRIYGTVSGAIMAYFILTFIDDEGILLGILWTSMILCFALLVKKYAWAVFFMTIYVFIGFNFLHPGNIDIIFRDRLIDTFIAGVIAAGVSYFVLPIWEQTHSLDFMKKSAEANLIYLEDVMDNFFQKCSSEEDFRTNRKNAIIHLTNLSDNFQRMISDPKHKQKKLEIVHQYVNTSHLITAYIASLAQYIHNDKTFEEIDWKNWKTKISNELQQVINILHKTNKYIISDLQEITTNDEVERLLLHRKNEIENKMNHIQNSKKVNKLTELKNLREILELLIDVCREQKKVARQYITED